MEGADLSELPRVNHFLQGPACVDWACPWELCKAEGPNAKSGFHLLSPVLTLLSTCLAYPFMQQLTLCERFLLQKEGFIVFFFFQ